MRRTEALQGAGVGQGVRASAANQPQNDSNDDRGKDYPAHTWL